MSSTSLRDPINQSIPFYRDVRIIAVIAQIVFVIVVGLVGWFLVNNMLNGLRASSIPLGWDFLNLEAGFAISEGPVFEPTDTYQRAFFVGVINTLRIAVSGIILATILGIVTGIARLSNNWLLRNLAGGYIEIIRNTPLLVQLFIWYFAVILKLPDLQDGLSIPGVALLSKRGVALTWPFASVTGQTLVYWVLGGLILGAILNYLRKRRLEQEGLVGSGLTWAVPGFLAVIVVGYVLSATTATLPDNITYELRRGDRGTLFVDEDSDGKYRNGVDTPMGYVQVTLLAEDGSELATIRTDSEGDFRFYDLEVEGTAISFEAPPPVIISQPRQEGFAYTGGQQLTPEFAALLLGLVVYTAAFIAEIVRAGINAVSKGQWEAARALGLSNTETLRMIVLPQALRVIIPPLTSQYLNLTKNSSLAIAVGYPDLFNVSRTVFNQSGAAVQMFVLIMATYLTLSLLTSGFMNWYNARVALVER